MKRQKGGGRMEWKFIKQTIKYVYECKECGECEVYEFEIDEDHTPDKKQIETEINSIECSMCGAK